MALINNIYVHCEEESITDDAELTSHPTESGVPISDTVRKTSKELSIKGKIVNYDSLSTEDIIGKLRNLKDQGSLITFKGTNTLTNLQINRFSYSSNYKINGGVEFTMSLIEHRIAKSAYTAPKSILTAEKNSLPFIVGSTVLFTGGYVYVSSDAKNWAAKRGKSTCELTKISSLSGATHIYHLISKDCTYGSSNYVYGWVDAGNVSRVASTSLNASTTSGLQLVSNGTAKKIYHIVSPGDCVWNLVTHKYKYLNTTVSKVIEDNPTCFRVPGDASTLKLKSRLYMGIRYE